MSNKITAPFTDEQVKNLNNYQASGRFHPFTCCSHDGCERGKREDEGVLIATTEGWVCPCGKWKQDWAHSFMAEPQIRVSNEVKDYSNDPFFKKKADDARDFINKHGLPDDLLL